MQLSSKISLAELKSLAGLPARVTLVDKRAPEGTVRIPGIIRQVTAVGLTTELFYPAPATRSGAPSTLEIMGGRALLQCFTTVRYLENPQLIHLNLPEQVHSIQRRQHPRVPVNLTATVIAREIGLEAAASVLNLSAGGCLIVLPKPIAISTQVQVQVETPGMDSNRISATVVRCLPSATAIGSWEAGVAFSNVPAETVKQISQYVQSILDSNDKR